MVHECMVSTERAEMAAVSRGTSHVTTKQRCKFTTSVDKENALQKASHSFRQERSESARERRIALYENDGQIPSCQSV